jgi:hypothetical protein
MKGLSSKKLVIIVEMPKNIARYFYPEPGQIE